MVLSYPNWIIYCYSLVSLLQVFYFYSVNMILMKKGICILTITIDLFKVKTFIKRLRK